jgi:putative DNA primase/helicase
MDLFKGYLPMRDKRALEPYKDRTSFYTQAAVSELAGYGGVLADGFIQIDLDESAEAEILLRIIDDLKIGCRVLKTTRGMHFYFQNNGQDRNRIKAKLAVGLTADIGVKNRLIPLKIEGIVRSWLREPDQMEALPLWLNPVDQVPDFTKMDEGDGRNQTLFNYILALQAAGFSKPDIRFTLQIVNQYVLKSPLPKRELETILRDEAFIKPAFFRGNTFLHYVFAEYLCREEHMVVVNNRLHVFNGQIYTPDPAHIERRMITHLASLTQARRKEFMSYLKLITPRGKYSGYQYIAMANGILDINELTLLPFSPDLCVPNQIPHDWNPEANAPIVDTVLDRLSCQDRELRNLLEEAPGYALLRRSEYGAAFFLSGDGDSGKSTYLDMVKSLLGEHNISSLHLKELDIRFKTAELYGKLANIGDDIGKAFIEDDSTFKNIATGNRLNVERKNEDPFDFNPYAKLFFSANDMPRIKDTTNGLMRRLCQIPFRAKFSSEDPDYDPFIKDKILSKEGMERFLVLAVHGLLRILANRGITQPKAVIEEKREYELKNNPVLQYAEDHTIVGNTTKDAYRAYAIWCHENGHQPVSSIEFGRELNRLFKIQSKPVHIGQESMRIYEQK